MKALVQVIGNELKVSHRDIAVGTNNQAKNIVELINKYKNKFERFGEIEKDIEIIKAGNGSTQRVTYWLNEAQVTSLITLLRNNEIVLDFKFKLVEEFIKMRNLLLNPNIHELSGRVGGLTKANNDLRKELDKWKKKFKIRFENLEGDVDELKSKQFLITHKSFDEKLDLLFKRNKEILNRNANEFNRETFIKWLQEHNVFYGEYLEILRTDGTELQR
ncbi:Rha family transcriptional regulator [Aliarcobacter butzleri]|nr:Rha family transcriptional regulator [Aliarcobacter butzleri]MCG3671977.1 Rha family transcriptional regulator [Aliarcobacter butzleri]